ncbi:MAG: helix-turn-helix domain-containing protein [Arcobacter sp.]|uniref:helix-turn-helix domain-containing protein n=1 Tax=Arcobacter sp. TaxID=1872629 RepID=UPI002586052A|nr:helix-turn-helix domain-containing protein [Arcobacter sp.]MDD3008876.1 helix-turn-helix domain-containing protein [Arcobacter sp.]
MEELLPKRISFSLRELEELGFLKVPTAKKLIKQKKLKSFKVGSKNYVTRDEVLDYVERNSCI